MPSGTTTSDLSASSISTQADEQGAKHTPGPWRVAYGEDWAPLPSESDQEICCLPHAVFDAVDIFAPQHRYGPHCCKLDEFIANARLIAAAPDMLEALHIANNVINGLTSDSKYDPAKQLVREAIAKATQS